jgi:hypothetical protein
VLILPIMIRPPILVVVMIMLIDRDPLIMIAPMIVIHSDHRVTVAGSCTPASSLCHRPRQNTFATAS